MLVLLILLLINLLSLSVSSSSSSSGAAAAEGKAVVTDEKRWRRRPWLSSSSTLKEQYSSIMTTPDGDTDTTTNLDSSSLLLSEPASIQLRPRIICLNIMVAGLSGLGKTTTCNSLLESWWEDTTTTISKEEKKKKKTTITTVSVDPSRHFERYDQKANTIFRIRIIDTPGFGNCVNHHYSVRPIRNYIEQCRNRRFKKEMSNNKEDDTHDDSLVHVCLYFLSPGRLLEIDKHFLQTIQQQLTIVPIISKSDTMTDDEIAVYRSELRDTFLRERIRVYDFDTIDDTTKTTTTTITKRRGRRSGEIMAIISRDGSYPWGKSSPSHSDLQLIRDLLLSKHTERFLESAARHYTDYRTKRIQRRYRNDVLKYVTIFGLSILQIIQTTTTTTTTTGKTTNTTKAIIVNCIHGIRRIVKGDNKSSSEKLILMQQQQQQQQQQLPPIIDDVPAVNKDEKDTEKSFWSVVQKICIWFLRNETLLQSTMTKKTTQAGNKLEV